MKIDANLGNAPLKQAGDLSRRAEDLGFEGLWVTELTHSAYNLMGLAATHTDQAEIGTAIALAFPRSPMVTAYTSWDLQELSDGRFILGLGTQVKGHIERRFSVTWDSPGPRLRDYVKAVRSVWNSWATGEPVHYEGDFYSITLCPPTFTPEPITHPDIPIYVAGVNEYNIQLAGELCDGLHVHPLHTPEYLSDVVVPNLRKGAERAGRDPSEVTLATTVLSVVGNTEEEREKAREEVREQISFYGSTRTYRTIFEVHGWEALCDDLHELSVNNRWDEMPDLVTDEMVEAFSVRGSWDQLRQRMKDRYTHMDRVAVYRPFRGEDFWKEF